MSGSAFSSAWKSTGRSFFSSAAARFFVAAKMARPSDWRISCGEGAEKLIRLRPTSDARFLG